MLSTLQQQLTRKEIDTVKRRLKLSENDADMKGGGISTPTLNDFELQMKELNKRYNEAKDNGKKKKK